MAKNTLKHDVFSKQMFKSPSTSPTLPGITNGCDGLPKAEGMPFPTVTTVKVAGK